MIKDSVAVSDGVFSVSLDFGANVFTGANRYMEISVRRNSGETYTVLTPRQQIASSPYSICTLSAQQADTALDSQKLGGVAASEYVTNSTVGSSFIRNVRTLQTAGFTISGNGFIGGSIGLGASVDGNFRLNTFGAIRSFSASAAQFGASTDRIVPADYTGDGKTDIAFFRPSTNQWFVLRSEDSSFYAFPFGSSTDVPVPGDYDGDGKFDAAVFRPSTATWFLQRATAGTQIQQFGITGDQPVPNAFVP